MSNNKKVLIIDDTKNIRFMLTKCMNVEGYEVDTADNGKEGLEKAVQNSYALIFLDIKLPEISGTEVLRRLRGKGVLTPVIIITAYPTVRNAVECTQLGAVQYLQKPFTTERIGNVLKELDLDASTKKIRDLSFDDIEKLIEQESYEEVLNQLKLALSVIPSNSRVYHLLGKVYSLMGNEEMAKKFYRAEEIFRD